jgi:hypothetical protein
LGVPQPGDDNSAQQDWAAHLEREERRYHDGEERLPGQDGNERERQLTRLANVASGAGLALLM